MEPVSPFSRSTEGESLSFALVFVIVLVVVVVVVVVVVFAFVCVVVFAFCPRLCRCRCRCLCVCRFLCVLRTTHPSLVGHRLFYFFFPLDQTPFLFFSHSRFSTAGEEDNRKIPMVAL